MNTLQRTALNDPTSREEMRSSALSDARRSEISIKGSAHLQWGFYEGIYPQWSLQMPEEVVDQILAWRDQAQSNT